MWLSPVAAMCMIASIASAQYNNDYHGSPVDFRDRDSIRNHRSGSILGVNRDRFGQNPDIRGPNLGQVSPVFQNRPIRDPHDGIYQDDLSHGRRQPYESDRRLPLDPRGANHLPQGNPRFQAPGWLHPIETEMEFPHDRKFGTCEICTSENNITFKISTFRGRCFRVIGITQ